MMSMVNVFLRFAVFGSPSASILLKITLTTALALAAVRLARRSRASVRHALLAASFVLLIILPFSSLIAPPIRLVVPIPAGQEIVRSSFGAVETNTPDAASAPNSISVPTVETGSRTFLPAVSLGQFLLALWLCGALLSLLPVAAGLWQTRSLRRSGMPWRDGKSIVDRLAGEAGIGRQVDVLLHEAVPGPMTCGVLNPAIMLPLDAPRWNPEELKRAMVHELEHVRRGDWLSRCLARILCAGYWFHPLVWMAWRRFVLEAERACDDAVLHRSEATAYADQLVVLAQRLLTEPNQPLLAMANRYDLTKRISALLDSRQRRGRAGAAWVSAAGLICAVLVAALSPIYVAARIQTPAPQADGRKFEVASAKPCRDEDFRIGNERRTETSFSPGRITVNCIPLDRIIYFAYAGIGSADNPLVNDSPGDSSHVRGGPDWIRTETFYIEGKADGEPARGVMMGPMLRALLEERFNLKTHRELEEVPMYALTVAKGGLKIKPIGPDDCIAASVAQNMTRDEVTATINSNRPICGNFSSLGNRWKRTLGLGGTTIARFANQILSGIMDMHVMDRTGIEGLFNIRLEFGYDDSIKQGVFGGRPTGPIEEPPAGVEPAPSIFTALERQLGLKLEKSRGPRGFLVIDSVERPAGLN